jgi:hypothetical protein
MPEYRVVCVGESERQLRDLKARMVSIEERQDLFATLIAVFNKLATKPLDWGDPERGTKKQGGTVCHGILSNVVVQYAVLENERVVFVFDVRTFETRKK